MTTPQRPSFFVSYATADRAWAEWLSWVLEDEGYSVRVQVWDFRPGSQFPLEMQEAMTQCQRTIAVLSPRYLGAQFTQVEWSSAFAADPTGKDGKLVPVRVAPFQPVGAFSTAIYIDLVGLDETTARTTLLNGIHRGRAKPASKPAFPAGMSEPEGSPAPFRAQFPGVSPASRQTFSETQSHTLTPLGYVFRFVAVWLALMLLAWMAVYFPSDRPVDGAEKIGTVVAALVLSFLGVSAWSHFRRYRAMRAVREQRRPPDVG